MTTVLHANARQFISTDFTKQIVRRALRYLQSGFAIHLRWPRRYWQNHISYAPCRLSRATNGLDLWR